MRMMTALALILVSVPAAYGAGPLTNESFIEQIGNKNDATISQKNGNNGQATFQAGTKNSVITDQASKAGAGNNKSGNVQVGKNNSATTGQTSTLPNPGFLGTPYDNNSFSAQFGNGNSVIAAQKGGQNTQSTLEVGNKNTAAVAQTDKSVTSGSAVPVGGANTSFTGQFGNGNTAATTQKSADGSSFGSFEPGHANAASSLQIGNDNEAGTSQKSVGGDKGQGVNNAAATVQIGKGNVAYTQQGGHVAGAFGATTADQIANFTNGSFVGQFGKDNDAIVNQKNGANTQATFQTGNGNIADIAQKTQAFGTGNGTNNALTNQVGKNNQVTLKQTMAVPLAVGNNNSLISQFGGSNVVNAVQSVGRQAMAGNNNLVSLQVGVGNSLTVAQATGANVTNTSFTAQYGSHNSATVSQK
jgi:hypothetical protein